MSSSTWRAPGARPSHIDIGSLFSGIGGIERGVEAVLPASRVSFQVEKDDAARAVLEKHWPDAQHVVEDVEDSWALSLPSPTILVGGFPCQDLSPANRRRPGLGGERSRLGWRFVEIAGALKPAALIIENSHHGWRGWVPQLRCALYGHGFASVPIRVQAADVGAPHKRARCFLLGWSTADAHRESLRDLAKRGPGRWTEALPGPWEGVSVADGLAWPAAHPDAPRLEGRDQPRDEELPFAPRCGWRTPPPAVRGVDDGLPAGFHKDRLRMLGNAVVPQAAALATVRLLDILKERFA